MPLDLVKLHQEVKLPVDQAAKNLHLVAKPHLDLILLQVDLNLQRKKKLIHSLPRKLQFQSKSCELFKLNEINYAMR